MPAADSLALWTTIAPTAWPQPPDEMTVSTLSEIETCPRRWALASAEYRGLWNGRGYPPRLQLASLAGSVVHLAIETLTRELVRAGCPATDHPTAVEVMRKVGGYTKLLNDCIDRSLARFRDNPRASRLLEQTTRSLRAQIPELRTRAQALLGCVRLPAVAANADREGGPKPPSKLTMGTYPEVNLRAPHIGWKGKADLVVLSPEHCEIIDFKTGAQDEAHRFQVQVYALLWNRDQNINPSRRLADKLTLAYKSKKVEVEAPSSTQLDTLEQDLIARRNASRTAVAARPPEARPSPENCRYCTVRQLCDRFWSSEVQYSLAAQDSAQFSDLEVTITGRHGASSWDGLIEVSRDLAKGRAVLVRTQGELGLRVGQRVRILDAHVATAEEDDELPTIITIGILSETFVVPLVAG